MKEFYQKTELPSGEKKEDNPAVNSGETQGEMQDRHVIAFERYRYVQEQEFRTVFREQKRPMWQEEQAKLPKEQKEKFQKVLEEVIYREENTPKEIAEEEARTMNEEIEELLREGKAKSHAEACALVFERKEYQLKNEKRVEQEESIRPYFLLVTKALDDDDLETAQGVIQALPPDKKEIFAAVRDVLDRPFEKKEKQYLEKGETEKLAKLMEARSDVTNQFDFASLERIDQESRKSPEFVQAATELLMNKLENLLHNFDGSKIKEYLWMRDKIVKAGVMDADKVDSNPEIRWKVVTVLVGGDELPESFLQEEVDRYQYLKTQMETAGIINKHTINQDPRVQNMFCSIFKKSFELDLSDEERLNHYLQLRERVSQYGIIHKNEVDHDPGIQENIQDMLRRQLSLNTSDEARINSFFKLLRKMTEEEMISPQLIKEMNSDEKTKKQIDDLLENIISKGIPKEDKDRYASLQEKINSGGVAVPEITDQWPDIKGVGFKEGQNKLE
jgi:hypothetical protein